jgi:Domain of unknown function (DUF4265)
VELPDSQPYEAETLWALPIGHDLYELRNSPWYAYDLNWGDVVQCIGAEDDLPLVITVSRRSGHQTLRVIFQSAASEADRDSTLARLNQMA